MKKTEIVDFKNAAAAGRTASFFDRLGSMLGMSMQGKRDIYDVYGYPVSLAGDAGYRLMYEAAARQGVANRLTWGVAKTCWRDGFEVRSDPDDEGTAELVDQLTALNAAGLAQGLEAADILNRIGRYSILLVGLPDGSKLAEPLQRMRSNDLSKVYFAPFAYDGASISQYETDETSPRYGLPVLYTLQVLSSGDKSVEVRRPVVVHWTRVVHMSENTLSSRVEGLGSLEPVFNRILDLNKATGGSAEAYFRNARGKIAYEIDKDYAAGFASDPEAKEKFQEAAEKFTNQWQDHTVAVGATVKDIPTEHQSPLDTVKVSLWEISAYTGYPIRVLTGEGAGQLAGSEDQLAVNQITADRQRVVCAPWARRVLEILTEAGALEFDPAWTVVFPPQESATEAQQAEVDDKRSATLERVVRSASMPGGDSIDLESALAEFNLGSIEVDDEPLPEVEPLPELPQE